jgi:hypothetical protein
MRRPHTRKVHFPSQSFWDVETTLFCKTPKSDRSHSVTVLYCAPKLPNNSSAAFTSFYIFLVTTGTFARLFS